MDLTINKLFHKLIPDTCLDYTGKIKEEFKYKINVPELKIQNSKFIPNPEDKFETMLFLPPNPNRIAEGGLRTKGLFKFSYKLGMLNDELYKDAKNSTFNANHSTLNIQNLTLKEIWHICDLDGNPVIPAPDDIQNKINNYVSQFQRETPQFNIQHSTFNIISELPLITVITVVYNGAKYLEETIQSVINQTYPNVEYIIIDGGSTDGTIDIIRKYEDYVDYWVSEPDKGIYDAMNKGIIVSIGEWLNFMNSGDKFYEEQLLDKIFMIALVNKGYYDFIYSDTMLDGKNLFYCDISDNKIIHQSVIYRKKIHNQIGPYLVSENLFLSDYIFFMLCKKMKWFKSKEIISVYSTIGTENKFNYHFKQKIGVDLLFDNISRTYASIMLLLYPEYRIIKKTIVSLFQKYLKYLRFDRMK